MGIPKIKKKESTKVYGVRLTSEVEKYLLKSTGARSVSQAVNHLIELTRRKK